MKIFIQMNVKWAGVDGVTCGEFAESLSRRGHGETVPVAALKRCIFFRNAPQKPDYEILTRKGNSGEGAGANYLTGPTKVS